MIVNVTVGLEKLGFLEPHHFLETNNFLESLIFLESLSANQKFICLIGVVAALLLLASCIGWLLKNRLAKTINASKKAQKVVANLISRVNAWWVMVAIFAVAFLAGNLGTILLFAAISYFALREFITLTPTRSGDHRTSSLAFFCSFRCIIILFIFNGTGYLVF